MQARQRLGNCMHLHEMRELASVHVKLCLSAHLISSWLGAEMLGCVWYAVLFWINTAAVQEEQDGPQGLVDLSFLPRSGLAAGADSRDMMRWHSEPNLDAIL